MGHLLVVDDDLLTRTTLTIILEDAGYVVHTASDGMEALDAIRASRPRVIVSDIRLPRLGGLQLLEHLRSDSQTATLPVLLMSASVRPRLSESLYHAFLEKPIDIDTLLAVVAALIAGAVPHERFVGSIAK